MSRDRIEPLGGSLQLGVYRVGFSSADNWTGVTLRNLRIRVPGWSKLRQNSMEFRI